MVIQREKVFNLPSDIPDSQASAAWRQGHWPLRLAAGLGVLAVLALRLPMWMLPGPGRDEAAYHYWAHHPEPAYTPLLQAAVRLAEAIGGHSLWTLRAPVLVLGVLVIVLNDRRFALVGTPPTLRWLAALALAFSPWQSFASTILHPDNFLLAALLGLILAVQENRLWWATGAAVAAVLAKPTGVLFLPVLWWLSGRMEGVPANELRTARAMMLTAALGLFLVMDSSMVAGMADFGRMSPTLPWYDRGLAAGGAFLFLGGPLLVGFSWLGAHQRWRILRLDGDSRQQREARASLAAAAVLLTFFLAAVLVRGQFKGNWVLPAVVLLWPTQLPRRPVSPVFLRLAIAGLAMAFLGSLGQTVIHVRPDLISRLEKQMTTRGLTPRWATYATQAGVREATVSTSRTWSDHLREYEGFGDFAAEIKAGWCEAQGATAPLPWIVSDDYGIACQLHWYLGDPTTQVAICNDMIFSGTWTDLSRAEPDGPLLALSSTGAGRLPGGQLKSQSSLPQVLHPVTGRQLRPTVVYWQSHANQENQNDDLP